MTKWSELQLPPLPYLGRNLQTSLQITPFAHTRISLRNDQLKLALSSVDADPKSISANIAKHINNWLRAQARRAFCEDVELQKNKHGFTYNAVSIKDTRSRWGSCSAQKNLNFNWRLIMAPAEVLSYVVTHETAHLSYLDHSADFWKLVATRCPGYQHYKNWLDRNGGNLMSWSYVIANEK